MTESKRYQVRVHVEIYDDELGRVAGSSTVFGPPFVQAQARRHEFEYEPQFDDLVVADTVMARLIEQILPLMEQDEAAHFTK